MAGFEPLSGTRVLDLTRLLPGPYGTHLLAELGADVVKVERPGEGDYLRDAGGGSGEGAVSYYFRLLNADKRSVTLDLKSDEGTEVFRALAAEADVVVESFRPGVVDRLGIDYGTLRADNPGLVYCSLSGFGQESPYREFSGHDVNYLALSGILGLTGERGGDPVVPGTTIADLSSGTFLCLSVLAALLDGGGQYVDVSMTDVATTWTLPYAHHLFAGREPPSRGETRHQKYPSYGVYRTADDEYVALGAAEPKFWANLCRAVGLERHLGRHQSEDSGVRRRVREDLEEAFLSRTRGEWVSYLSEHDVPVSPVNDLREVVEDDHVRERDLIVEDADGHDRFRFPVRFGDGLEGTPSPPPELGSDTEEVLAELGLEPDEVDELRRRDVI